MSYRIPEANLPGNWKEIPSPSSTKDFGTALLTAGETVIKVPSAVIPFEFNYILNPLHNRSKDCKVISVRDFVYDVRVKIK